MANNVVQIWLDYNNAKKQADRLEEIAADLENLARKDLGDSINLLSRNWKGEAANAFCKKGQTVSAQISTNAGNLRKAAQTIRTIAQNTYKAEMEAVRLAQVRTYK